MTHSAILIKKKMMKIFLNFELDFSGYLRDFIYNTLFQILNNSQYFGDVSSEEDSKQYLDLETFFVQNYNKLQRSEEHRHTLKGHLKQYI